jgi:hypothetical protein
MLFFALFISLSTLTVKGTMTFEECKKDNFKHSACYEAEQLHKAGKFFDKVQGK